MPASPHGERRPRALVLAAPEDDGALRVARGLARRGDLDVDLVATEELLLAPEWLHDPLGSTRIVLGSGAVLESEAIDAVFCRVRHVDPPQFGAASARDRTYAQAEFFSLLLSWLESLGARVHNRPHAGSLVGTMAAPLEDRIAFAAAGLGAPMAAATDLRLLPRDGGVLAPLGPEADAPALAGRAFTPVAETVLGGGPALRLSDPASSPRLGLTVVDGAVIGPRPAADVEHCVAEALRGRGLTVAGVGLVQLAEGDLRPCAIDPFPALHAPEAVRAVVELLARTALEHAG